VGETLVVIKQKRRTSLSVHLGETLANNTMPRSIQIAAVQMDVAPAPTAQRLARAECLAAQAAQAGAQLVVLPELFNSGYVYADSNFQRAEQLDGMTMAWMRTTAARLGIHLAGSLLLFDQADIFNALFLFAPDGRNWRYDKNYPWGWERAYFRAGRGTTIASTHLGRIGLMICWDTAHLGLWRKYAGKIDLMLISSCPPDFPNSTYLFPNGRQVTLADMGPVYHNLKNEGRRLFDAMLNQQTSWLSVPLVNTVASGQFRSGLPNGRATWLASLPTAPWLAGFLPLADQVQIVCGMTEGTRIVDARGQTLAAVSLEKGEALALADALLPDAPPPPPAVPQPHSLVAPFSYLAADRLLPWLSRPVYSRGLRHRLSTALKGAA
jgi:hypothetical protein